MSLSGKIAVVTGSTSGIGLGIARALRAGAGILLNGFGDAAEDRRTARRTGRPAAASPVGYSDADISEPAQVAAMMMQAAAELGGLDILVNNAGVQHVAPIEEFPDDQWDRIIAINLSGVFHCTKAAIPAMRRAPAGAGSSTSPRRTGWWPAPTRPPTSRPSMACWA